MIILTLPPFVTPQEGVRVAVTSFNNAVLKDDRTWDLTDYTSHEELNNAINLLQDDTVGESTHASFTLQRLFTTCAFSRQRSKVVHTLYGRSL